MAANRIVDRDVFFFFFLSFRACQGAMLHNIVLRNFLLNCTGLPFFFFFFCGKPYSTGIWYDKPESVLPISSQNKLTHPVAFS